MFVKIIVSPAVISGMTRAHVVSSLAICNTSLWMEVENPLPKRPNFAMFLWPFTLTCSLEDMMMLVYNVISHNVYVFLTFGFGCI